MLQGERANIVHNTALPAQGQRDAKSVLKVTFCIFGVCSACLSHCKTCQNSVECLQCNDGYFLSGATCTKCENGCKLCDNDMNCKATHEGYVLDDDGDVISCPTNCKVCSSAGSCLKCSENKFLFDGVCQSDCQESRFPAFHEYEGGNAN